jgi:hypothetical protein
MKKINCFMAIALSVVIVSCTKPSTSSSSSSNNNNNTGGVNINSTPQFTATINGSKVNLVSGSTYTSGVGASKQMGGTGATANYEEPSSSIGNPNTNQPYLTINKGTITFPLSSSMPDTATYDAFFAAKSYPYSINYANGIEIDWIDANGNIYNTSLGSGSQTGSTFSIVAEKAYYVLGNYEIKVVANFSCILYNSAGASIKLTNGVYVGDFEDQ